MFDEKELTTAFGSSDEGFKSNFDSVLAALPMAERPRRAGRMRRRTAAIILAACMVLTGTAYAITMIIVDRADVGAGWVLVSAPEDYYESVDAEIFRLIYRSGLDDFHRPRFDADTARTLTELLTGMVFDENGQPVDIIVPVPDSDEYYADDGGTFIYNKDGEAYWHLYYQVVGYSGPLKISTITIEQYETRYDIQSQEYTSMRTYDYQEAAQLLGVEFRLPGVYTEGLEPPEFVYQKSPALEARPGFDARPGREAIYVTYYGTPGIYFFAEATRDEDVDPYSWYAPGAIIEQMELDEATIYKAIDESMTRYVWAFDGVTYMMFRNYSPDSLTDEQVVEIIISMVK